MRIMLSEYDKEVVRKKAKECDVAPRALLNALGDKMDFMIEDVIDEIVNDENEVRNMRDDTNAMTDELKECLDNE